jgi:hypothetical protein
MVCCWQCGCSRYCHVQLTCCLYETVDYDETHVNSRILFLDEVKPVKCFPSCPVLISFTKVHRLRKGSLMTNAERNRSLYELL